ncbi:hypothetical protein CVT25_003610 [Psilocybe cyanescens]|uniref:HD domain-containing protein n=1 Tax=Psilocybe cyanescens TaxID=93625 RepID=A0A409WP98_PSICY|nr:hypothetical protein CVT25_003610 [Psilocybe cyanescens]
MDSVEFKRAKLTQWKLRRRFTQITSDLGASEATVEEWANKFIERYTEPQRHYHNLTHIYSMLECLDANRTLVKNLSALTLAILFHDWVYDPKAKDNEKESIKCFQQFAHEIELSDSLSSRVADYIERTITHTMPTPEDSMVDTDLKLFLDFDLEVLSRDDEQYAQYSKQIQAEYTHMEPNDYYAGRAQILRRFLDRDRIYFSELFYRGWEQKARANIKQEIDALEGKNHTL